MLIIRSNYQNNSKNPQLWVCNTHNPERTESLAQDWKNIREHFMVDLLKHNSLLKGWSWSALQSEHYWQALTSLPWYLLLKSSHSLPPCYTGTDASVCTCAQPFSRLQEQGSQLRAHSEEERSQESLWQFPPLPSAPSSIYPLLPSSNTAVTFFSPSSCNTGAEFWWDKTRCSPWHLFI